ncbi:hypothetical protein B0J14DRAFT_650340 [Halenospora varia]|nr:hypothetical protein B0J14DRAFT_650340 [Halenospora varia]
MASRPHLPYTTTVAVAAALLNPQILGWKQQGKSKEAAKLFGAACDVVRFKKGLPLVNGDEAPATITCKLGVYIDLVKRAVDLMMDTIITMGRQVDRLGRSVRGTNQFGGVNSEIAQALQLACTYLGYLERHIYPGNFLGSLVCEHSS